MVIRLIPLAALVLLAALTARTDAAEARGLLAPAGACPGDGSAAAGDAAQLRAMRCLVGAARHGAGLHGLRASATLARAARVKAGRIQACGSFTHTPCGAPFAAAFRAAGWHGRAMGENLAYAQSGRGAPREILSAWLRSPGHRANLLRPGFRLDGLAVRTADMPGIGRVRLWVHTFGR